MKMYGKIIIKKKMYKYWFRVTWKEKRKNKTNKVSYSVCRISITLYSNWF